MHQATENNDAQIGETLGQQGDGALTTDRVEIGFLDLLIVVAKRKKFVIKTTLTVTVLASIVSFLLPVRYMSTTKILPPQQNQSLAGSLMGQLGGLSPLAVAAGKDLGLKNPNDIYIGMLKSRRVEDGLIQKYGLLKVYGETRMSDARKDLERATDIESSKEGFITISVEDRDRKRSADLANAYVDELRGVTQNFALTEAGQRRVFFEQQVEDAKLRLTDAEEALKKTQENTGLIQLDSQTKAIIESVAQLRAQVAAKEVQLRAMQSYGTNENPDIIMNSRQLSAMRAQLASLEKQSAGNGDILVGTGKVPAVGLEYVRKMREVKYRESIFELLAKQYEAAKLDESKSAPIIQVVDVAIQADRRSSPRRGLIISVCAILAMLCSLLYALVADAVCRAFSEPAMHARLIAIRRTLCETNR